MRTLHRTQRAPEAGERTAAGCVSERGAALVLALFALTALMLLGSVFLASSLTETNVSGNELKAAKAFDLAEGGIERGRVALKRARVNSVLSAGGTLLSNQSLAGGTYGVTVANNINPPFPLGSIPADAGGAVKDTDGYVILTSTGTYQNATRQVEVIVHKIKGPFPDAIWSNTTIKLGGGAIIDTFDSSVGPYDPANAGSDQGVFANGNITLGGTSLINGDATAGGTITAGHTTGIVTTGAPPETMPILTCPANFSASVPSGPGINYNPANGQLKLNGGAILVLNSPPTSYFFSEISVSANSTITVNTGGSHMDVYISGKVDMTSGGIINTSTLPTSLTLSACGGGKATWKITGSGSNYYALYAPNRDITLTGISDLYGAVVAGSFTDTGGPSVHYDEALAGPPDPPAVIAGSWAEIFQ